MGKLIPKAIRVSALERISYKKLKPKQQEVHNFQKLAAVLADYGFNCIKLPDGWAGTDFLAHHKDNGMTLKVQLKGRPTINKKYQNKDIYIAFPLEGYWYIILHDELVKKAGDHTNWLKTPSWTKERGDYHSPKLSTFFIESLSKYRLEKPEDL